MAVVIFAGMSMFGGGQDAPKTIPARLEWMVTTNWLYEYRENKQLAWTDLEAPTVTTYHEIGTIESNLVAYVEWKGKVSSVVLESILVGTTNRVYTMSKPTRIYQ